MYLTKQLHMMGTVIDIQIKSRTANQQMEKVCQLFEIYKNRFSANDMDSELMAINLAAGKEAVKVHPDLLELTQIGKAHSLAQPSNLNIAIGPLVQTWRIGFSDAKVPSHQEITEKLSLTDASKIDIDPLNQSIFLAEEGMKIDLGALAKGYIADKIMAYLIKDGIENALINLGGNVLVHGNNHKRPDGLYYIGIQEPEKERGQNLGILKVSNQSVVTSGIYERRLKVGEKEYHHIFNRETGFPIETDMASLTIVADSSLDCEIWTTRLFGLDSMTVYNLINHHPDIEGIIVTKDKRVAITNGIKNKFTFTYQA